VKIFFHFFIYICAGDSNFITKQAGNRERNRNLNRKSNMKTIQIQDPSDKNNTFVFSKMMTPLGIVHCIASCEWEAISANGQHIDFFTSKKDAIAAIA
jgi:hypothetical protein